jgi:hypothetical protein
MGKFDMETRLSIHLTFAEIHYRTGSDIFPETGGGNFTDVTGAKIYSEVRSLDLRSLHS